MLCLRMFVNSYGYTMYIYSCIFIFFNIYICLYLFIYFYLYIYTRVATKPFAKNYGISLDFFVPMI